jgi:2-polyprenyl-3-methyl-5-hydroxy-6-metoxy-1,4-benzoquinol methylase
VRPIHAADVHEFVRAALPAPPARVLEVGAGDGELADSLTAGGHEVVAIDPASESPPVRRVALHELEGPPASFDAAVAVVSLHHVEPLGRSFARLAELVKPGGALVVDEFDVEGFDRRAAEWLIAKRRAAGDEEHTHPPELVSELRAHLHSVDLIRETLGEWFELEDVVRVPYLYRWDLPPGLHEEEARLVAAGSLPATGARFVGVRRET